VGVETYFAKTFSPQRYEIWTMQSAYHNCPTIDGVMQSAGRQFAATEVKYHSDDRGAELGMNLAKAYPPESHLASWNRSLRLDRARNSIEITDDYRLTQAAKVITLTLMTPCPAEVSSPGEVRLPMRSGNPVRVGYDRGIFHTSCEEIPIHDEELRASWGERLYRVLLRAEAPPLQWKGSLHITR